MLVFCRKFLAFTLSLALSLVPTLVRHAEAQPQTTAPVPSQILQAHTVFVSNAGGDPLFTDITGGVNRAYDRFYADLQRWPRLTLVPTPQQADLILEIHSLAHASLTAGDPPTNSIAPELQLRILDPATRTTLWTLDSWLHNPGLRQRAHDRSVDDAAEVLVLQLQQLMGEQLTPDQAKQASSRPGPSRRSTWIWIGVTVVAVVVPLAIVLATRHSQPRLAQPVLPPQPVFP